MCTLPVVNIKNLRYKNILSIDRLSISSGVVTCIIGESGSGKSTLLKMIDNMISPEYGTIEVLGKSIDAWNPIELRRRIVMMSQTPVMFPGDVRENLLIGLKFSDMPPVSDSRLKELLDMVRLHKSLDDDSDSLSGGEAQRVSLARILLINPPILLLDEPSSALDEETTAFVLQKVVDHVKASKSTLIMVTHSSAVVREFAEQVIEIENGHVIKEGGTVER
ncbi:ATP-binding cassette domain-containing protein [Sporolactobacillus sp. Y61]|uniref:ATP-binding cassette domain-containing protein n=1 Tax=Sporolactobacillus sp. Y61 TaxID=3160863 RepID=A0AAU8IDI7_9BACL